MAEAEVLASVRGFPSRGGASLDLDIRAGEAVRVVGPNGSGKTSLLRALAGLDAPLRPAAVRGPHAAWMAQDARDGLVGLTVAGEFRLRGGPFPSTLSLPADRDVATLSSGEARQVALDVVQGSDAPLLLLDEPLEGLDTARRQALEALIAGRGERAIVFVDHGDTLAHVADRTLHLVEPPAPRDLPALPRRDGDPRLRAPAGQEDLAGTHLAYPAVALGSGLHAVTGPNGSGKSRLLRRLGGLDEAGATVDGAPVVPGTLARLHLPHARDALWHDTVREELAGCDPTVRTGFVDAAWLDRHPLTLSGGEAQRVALAKTLGAPAPVYLLDEPEAHLDRAGRWALWAAMALRLREGACIVAATHDPALLSAAQERIPLGAAP